MITGVVDANGKVIRAQDDSKVKPSRHFAGKPQTGGLLGILISAACVTFTRGGYWDKSLPKTLQLNIVDQH